MNVYFPYFDPADVDTPAGMTPALSLAQITGVPAEGSGLSGAAFAPGGRIKSISDLNAVIAAGAPDATFTSTQVLYGARHSDTTIAEFLDDDAASISGDGDLEMGPSGMTFTGFIFIPEGVHEIAVVSDDGFSLSIGGMAFSSFEGARSSDETARVAEFAGGLYAIDLAYFDAGGAMNLSLEIDGLTVDPSALYQSVADFQNPPAGLDLIPVGDYHPSRVIADAFGEDDDITGGAARDEIDAGGGDDTVDGGAGDDEIYGGYGDDSLEGGDGDDVIDGGRGSDLLIGGDGNDLLISRSDAGEQRIGQLAIGRPTRGDPDNEVNEDRQKLKGWESQPLVSDDIMIGGEGRDTFLISPQLNGKLEIIEKHVRKDGTINWAGVAGENDELHDHWTDSFGIVVIADYEAGVDQMAVIGHTANIDRIEYRDVNGDGFADSIVDVISKQHGNGGAHDRDLIGQIIVLGASVEADDFITDAGVTYGVVETIGEVAEALFPVGETKTTVVDGETVFGYDTRDDKGNFGAVTGSPEDHVENPYATLESLAPAGQASATANYSNEEELVPTRGPFDQLGFQPIDGEVKQGGSGNDLIAPTEAPEPAGLPGALAYYSLAGGVDGAYEDARGGAPVKAYTFYENQALLRTDGGVHGPDGAPNGALSFNGEDEFAYIPHDERFAVTQGTIALWVKPEDLDDKSIFLSKDQKKTGDGGHFRLGHTDDGGLLLRMAPGDGGGNRAWETHNSYFTEGQWSHVAVSFQADGVTVYVNGQEVGPNMWRPVEGDDPTPAIYREAYILQNEEPWVLGADQARTEDNDTAQIFALDDEDLENAFEGALSGFGVWGGFTPEDALTEAEIDQLIAEGPGAALTNPVGPQPIPAGADQFAGGAGNDTILGEGGDDSLYGGAGDDEIEGGYGDDSINGGSGNDTIDGGRGSDLMIGGTGDDLLISRADIGEDRAGQLVLGEPSRPTESISDEFLKLYDWIDQPLVGDDILIGGEGADHFLFETLINGTEDIITDNMLAGGRLIDWSGGGVAGENTYIHDHWVDGIGIEIIADFNAEEDTISVIGHTTLVEVSYNAIDTNGDGIGDSVVSIITAYSQQGKNGGAHDEDILGYIAVHGDLVTEDDVNIHPHAHLGIVDTVDELQEALAPTGETKISTGPNGETLFGYDTRDVAGDPIGSDPESFSSNPYLDQVAFDDAGGRGGPFTVLLEDDGDTFDGLGAIEIAHDPALQVAEGTYAFAFTADDPGGRDQAILSKDHSGYEDGGHLTIWLDKNAKLNVRFQTTDESIHLRTREAIEAGEETTVSFSFSEDALSLYVNGELADEEEGVAAGMLGNAETLMLGASTRRRNENDRNLEWFFEGTIAGLAVIDRALTPSEAVLLGLTGDLASLTQSVGAYAAPDDEDNPELSDPVLVDSGDPVTPPADDEPSDEPGDVEDDTTGDAGDDTMTGGGDGSDSMMGGGGSDTMTGGGGSDTMIGGGGGDSLEGGAGKDKLKGGAGADSLMGGGGKDKLVGGAGDDLLDGGGGKDRLIGGEGDDVIFGGGGKDNISGGAGEDDLSGDGGKDRLKGGSGEDTLEGGKANDVLIGGGGEDLFVFGADDGRDQIRDFDDGVDQIEIIDGAASFEDITVSQPGRHTIVEFANTKIILRGVEENVIDADDFVF